MKNSTDELSGTDLISRWVIHRSNAFWICNKPAGMPLQADKTGDKPLLDVVASYAHRQFYPVHRLDRPVSGLVILARSKNAAAALSKAFQNQEIKKTYLAVVSSLPDPADGTLRFFIRAMDHQNKAIITDGTHPDDREAILHYRTLLSSDRYHLLEVHTEGGRFHQIRVQLSSIGCPIKGDVKYGARRANHDRSIHLHAWRLEFAHPVSGELMQFEAPLPAEDGLWMAMANQLSLKK